MLAFAGNHAAQQIRRRRRGEASVDKMQHLIRDAMRLIKIMRRENHGRAEFVADVADNLLKPEAMLLVHVRGKFI